ncbi:MAG: acetolactate synthase large subunit [Hyphomicrobiales bacterium]
MTEKMNGAESLVHTLVKSGADTCFANPGTSEMHFVAALDRIPGIRCVPGMQENVVTGMADGYGRIAGRPAVTLLHCGPGLANGIANLHNARKARSPVVNVVGDQATYHAGFDPPLAMDTLAAARSCSHWVDVAERPQDVGHKAAQAVAQAQRWPGRVATLILPSDASWSPGGVVAAPVTIPPLPVIEDAAIAAAAAQLAGGRDTLLLLGGKALSARAQAAAHRIQVKTGCRLLAESIVALQARGQGRLPLMRVPYPAPQAIDLLKDVRQIVSVCARKPVGFFAYPGLPSFHAPEDAGVTALASVEQDGALALEMLADHLGCPAVAMPDVGPRPDVPKGQPSSDGFAQMLAAVMPEQAIVADEGISFGWAFYPGSVAAPPHDWMMVTGGAIGYGMPAATGAAIAGKGRRVINVEADGSAMYTIQALWTQARERLPVTTVIINNRKYQILIGEYSNVGANPGPTAMNMLDLGNPDLDFVKLAEAMGVEAARATTLEDCAALMQQSFRKPGPFLIDLLV